MTIPSGEANAAASRREPSWSSAREQAGYTWMRYVALVDGKDLVWCGHP